MINLADFSPAHARLKSPNSAECPYRLASCEPVCKMNPQIPGMVVAASAHEADGWRVDCRRTGPNNWWLATGDGDVVASVIAAASPMLLPSRSVSLGDADRRRGGGERAAAVTVAKVELDTCGSWVTVANAGSARPILVRRAGWVDLRGHPAEALGLAPYEPLDDRVGLGPGDVLLLRGASAHREGHFSGDVAALDVALRFAAGDADHLVGSFARARAEHVLALGVLSDLGDDPVQRVAMATGVPVDQLRLPGYPLGDLQPDLWQAPPRPPRVARLRLTPDLARVAVVRALLDRLLASWRLGGRVDDGDLKLVSTELAANAVVHTGQPDAVTVAYLGPVVRVEVTDHSSTLPALRPLDPESPHGRGLHLVNEISDAWGVERTPDGKLVWCEIPVAVSAEN